PCWVMQSWLTPSHVPSPSTTAKTGGLPWVHRLHSACCSFGFVGSKLSIIGLILRPLMPPASLIWFTKRWMAFVCSPYSASDSISNSPSMLVNEMIGNTTLMASDETPRVLVLAWVTGVGPLVAPAGPARPRATALPRMATAPIVWGSRRPLPESFQRRIAYPRVRA